MAGFLYTVMAATVLSGYSQGALASTTAATTLVTCLQAIDPSHNSVLTSPGSTNYSSDRYGFNLIYDYKPAAIYHPATIKSAAAAVKCAAANNVSVAPRSGGHSYEGYSEGGKDGALVIDLNLLQGFTMNTTASVATVGAGFRLGPLYAKLWNAGQYLMTAGTCASVGIGGHALGGGLGNTARKYGTASQNIVGLTMIDATGKVLDIDSAKQPDLFWALRGAGGGSFGLVTEFRLQVYKAPAKVTTISVEFPLDRLSTVIDAYTKWGLTATEDLSTQLVISRTACVVQGTHLGPRSDANAALADLLSATGPASYQDNRESTWLEAVTRWAWLANGTLADPVIGDTRYTRGRSLVYRQSLSTKEKSVIQKYITSPPSGSSSIYVIIDLWGGKADHPRLPSAFDNHSGVRFGIQYLVEWGQSEAQPGLKCSQCLDWSAKFAQEMRAAYGSASIEAYQNYIERDLPGALNAYYGTSLPRLKQIKKAVDPSNIFSFPQSIPLPN